MHDHYSFSSRMRQEAKSYLTDASTTSSFNLGSCSIFSANLAPTSPDFIRRANRTVVTLNPPLHSPIVLCSDEFSNYYGASGVAYFRMLGNINIDSVTQIVAGSIDSNSVKSLVSWPQGSQISALSYNDQLASALNVPFKSSSFKVVYPKDSTDSLVGFFPEPAEMTLSPLNSEDYRGIEFGNSVCAFSRNPGSVYMVGSVLTDASFVARVQLNEKLHYLFVHNATTLDWADTSVLSSKTPISCDTAGRSSGSSV